MVDVNRLKGEIKGQGYRTSDFAALMGVTKPCLYNLFSGKTAFRLDHIERISAILNLTAEQREMIFFANNVPKMGLRQ